jgi:hypothetical protein
MEFEPFPKMARLSRECVITEKIDGTNAQIGIDESGTILFAGSRTRWLAEGADNFGFYAWCMANREELLKLGPGRHFGEWWGSGIQRGYGLPKGEKRFSLFNVSRWHAIGGQPYTSSGADPRVSKDSTEAPACCGVVPILYRGLFHEAKADHMIERLKAEGSLAAPGFMKPEGVVIFHTHSGTMFKKTLEKDEQPKSAYALQ